MTYPASFSYCLARFFVCLLFCLFSFSSFFSNFKFPQPLQKHFCLFHLTPMLHYHTYNATPYIYVLYKHFFFILKFDDVDNFLFNSFMVLPCFLKLFFQFSIPAYCAPWVFKLFYLFHSAFSYIEVLFFLFVAYLYLCFFQYLYWMLEICYLFRWSLFANVLLIYKVKIYCPRFIASI